MKILRTPVSKFHMPALFFVAWIFLTIMIFPSVFGKNVELVCVQGVDCKSLDSLVEKIKLSEETLFVSVEEIRPLFNKMVTDGQYINFSAQYKDNTKTLVLVIEGYKKIKDYRFIAPFTLNSDQTFSDLKLKRDISFREFQKENFEAEVKKYFNNSKINNFEVTSSYLVEGDDVVVLANVVPLKKIIVSRIHLKAPGWFKKIYEPFFYPFLRENYDPLSIKLKVDFITKELHSLGYFHSRLVILDDTFSENPSGVQVNLELDLKERQLFHFNGNNLLTNSFLKSVIQDRLKIDQSEIDLKVLEGLVIEQYERRGVYQSNVKIHTLFGRDKNNSIIKNYFFKIQEGSKLRLELPKFNGANSLSKNVLLDLYSTDGTDLSRSGFYDQEYLGKFSDILLKKYYSMGFVNAEVSKPLINVNLEKKLVSVEYYVIEKEGYRIGKIDLSGLEESYQSSIKASLKNQEGAPIDLVSLESDIFKIPQFLKSQGYYFSNVNNAKEANLLQYNKDERTVDIKPKIELADKVCFHEMIIAGNRQTKNQVFERELNLQKGEIITPEKIEEYNQKLSSLGLFANHRVTPYILYGQTQGGCHKTNILIQVKEKDFGVGEIAPGYRTDLGAKLSLGVTYNNWQGMNRQLSFQAQSNLRSNLRGFDQERVRENKERIEYTLKTSFIEPYAFYNAIKTQVEFEAQASIQRKRFYGFDADIYRISPQLSKSITKNISTSLKYQFERIEQYDATESIDDDRFFIGSLSPSITLDLRDDVINTRRGAYFNITTEWANKYFLSMNQDDLEINYIKITSRNRFYYTVGPIVFATSISYGYQRNYANDIYRDPNGNTVTNSNGETKTKGYIPSIKLFRLEGYDEVRGFEDSEINLVETGEHIGKIVVQDALHFINFKFEPRYNLSDQTQLSVFFDAGKLYLNQLQPLDLRTAIGAGFKILTPVGSIDFDYGVKLKREERNGTRESFGRFHFSIGFF